MSEINYVVLFSMILVNGGLLLLTYRKIPQNSRRVYYLCSIISMFIFSGFGISYKEIGHEYLYEYILFSSIFIITLFLIMKSDKNSQVLDFISDKINAPIELDRNKDSMQYNRLFVVCTVLFYLTFLIFLVVPEMRITQLWNPPSATVIGGYERISIEQDNKILDIALMMRTALLPFFMVHLNNLKKRRSNIWIVILVLLWIYLYFLSQSYISRYELVVMLIFLFVLLTAKKSEKLYISRRQLLIIAIALIISVPALLSYQYTRIGDTINDLTFGQALSELIGIELQFPKYYASAIILSEQISPLAYFLWFILLPIPSLLLPNKGALTIQLNRVFSSFILGINYGASGYYGLVPSILGEAFLLYGQYFFWIHAIFLAIMLGCICKILEKSSELSAFNLYIAIYSVAIARGGTQGYFGMVINSLIFYIVFRWLLISYNKRRH